MKRWVIIANDNGGEQHVYGMFASQDEGMAFAETLDTASFPRDERTNACITACHYVNKPGEA